MCVGQSTTFISFQFNHSIIYVSQAELRSSSLVTSTSYRLSHYLFFSFSFFVSVLLLWVFVISDPGPGTYQSNHLAPTGHYVLVKRQFPGSSHFRNKFHLAGQVKTVHIPRPWIPTLILRHQMFSRFSVKE